MALNSSIASPNLKVFQIQKSSATTFATPSLGGLIIGPCKEIVNAFDDNGNLNDKAKFCPYTQLPLLITQSAFPSPRNNIAEVTVENDTIRVFNEFGGSVKELPLNPGSAFLGSYNKASRAVVRTSSSAGFAAVGTTLVLSINNPVRLNTNPDVSITFTGTNPLTPAQIAEQINSKVGYTVASAVTLPSEGNPRCEILSTVYGAISSITVRGGGSANTLLGFSAQEERVEGSGFWGQDDNFGNDTLTPWIEWHRGNYYLNGTIAAYPVGNQYGQMNEAGVYLNGQTPAVTFGTGQTLEIKVGDEFYADGILVNSGEVMKVEVSRFKIGVINQTLSTYDTSGKLVTIVRDQTQVRLYNDPIPFAPRYSYFIAKYINVNTLATAATLTGLNSGTPAEAAFVESTVAPGTPLNLTGLDLRVTVTVDEVEQAEFIYVFTGGPFANMAAVVTAIGSGIPNVVATDNGGKLKLSTQLTGKSQAIKLAATSTANSALSFSTLTDTTDIGQDVEFVATSASLVSGTITFPLTLLAGDLLSIDVSSDSGATFPVTKTHTSAGAVYANIGALVSALQADALFLGGVLTISNSGNSLIINSVATGSTVVLRVAVGSTAVGPLLINYTIGQLAQGTNGIQGKDFKFQLNQRTKIYRVTFTSNSLTDAINLINESVGTVVAYAGGVSLDKLKFISTLKGFASEVYVINETATQSAIASFGFSSPNDLANGTGRPDPDAWLDVDGNINLSAELLRSPVTGIPYDPAESCLYIQYRGLRLDVSPSAKEPGFLGYYDPADVETDIGPITPENPLAMGMYLALLNAPNTLVRGIGIDEISGTYPEGTPDAYSRAIRFCEADDDYTLVPLSQAADVMSLFNTFVKDIHDPAKGNAQRPKRARLCPKIPTRAVDKLISSGLSANTPVATTNQINLDVNPSSKLLSAGINPALPIAYSSQVLLKFAVNGVIRNYSVAQVNGVNVTLRTTFGVGENIDGFFSTTVLSETVVNADWTMAIRGAELKVPGTTRPDYRKIAEAINEYAQTLNTTGSTENRRISYDFPDTAKTILNNVTLTIPGYYFSCIAAGARSYNNPQQSLSNFLLKGLIGKTDSKMFTETELDIIAGGGVCIFKSDQDNFPVYMRHQLTNDVSSIEVREESIGTVLDVIELLVRRRLFKYLGNRNIDAALIDELSTVVEGIKQFLITDVGAVEDFKITQISRNPDRPDGIIMAVQVKPFYPFNELKFYIYF